MLCSTPRRARLSEKNPRRSVGGRWSRVVSGGAPTELGSAAGYGEGGRAA